MSSAETVWLVVRLSGIVCLMIGVLLRPAVALGYVLLLSAAIFDFRHCCLRRLWIRLRKP